MELVYLVKRPDGKPHPTVYQQRHVAAHKAESIGGEVLEVEWDSEPIGEPDDGKGESEGDD